MTNRQADPLLPPHLLAPPPANYDDYGFDPFDLSHEDYPQGDNPDAAAQIRAVLADLNESQTRAVTTTQGPVWCNAGPGTGKTRVLTSRTAYIILSDLAAPREVLMITFTNKAASEMRNRLAATIGDQARAVWIYTFHGFCNRVLRTHPQAAGLNSSAFKILDESDQKQLVSKAFKTLGRHPEKPARDEARISREQVNEAHRLISAAKDLGLSAEHPKATNAVTEAYVDVWRQYDASLIERNSVDFADLIRLTIRLFDRNPAILRQWQDHFKYIMVDEAQDTNYSQYILLKYLASRHRNLAPVGDLAQSIFAWRGASSTFLLNFPKHWPDSITINLEDNYRSTQEILTPASNLIRHNKHIPPRHLRSPRRGALPLLHIAHDEDDEGQFIATRIKHHASQGTPLHEMAILVRTKYQLGTYERALRTAEIPYKVIGGPRFYEREEIADALAFVRTVVDPHDDLAFARIANRPARDLGPAGVTAILDIAVKTGHDLISAAVLASEQGALRAKAAIGAMTMVETFNSALLLHLQQQPHSEIINTLLYRGGYLAWLKDHNEPESYQDKVDHLDEFCRTIDTFAHIADFLAHSALMSRSDAKAQVDAVNLQTLHSAKGAEYEIVFIPALEDGRLPNAQALTGPGGIEEERNLAFVGLTRAKRYLYPSRAEYRYGKPCLPSPFITEAQFMAKEDLTDPKMHRPSPEIVNHLRSLNEPRTLPGLRR